MTIARTVWDFMANRQWVPFIAAVTSLAAVVSDVIVDTEFGWGAALPIAAAVVQWQKVYSAATVNDLELEAFAVGESIGASRR